MDWKASLEALKTNLPEGPANPAETETDSDTDRETSRKQPRLDIILDKKGRKGKAATIIAGFIIDSGEIEALATRIKQSLGTGGSVRGGEILIQGDKRKEVLAALTAMGFKARVI